MKIQLEELDVLRPWPQLALREGYHSIRVLVRIGRIPVGEVMTRPARSGRVIPKRLARRISRKLVFPLLKILARRALAAGPNVMANLPPVPGRPIGAAEGWRSAAIEFVEKILQPGGLPQPWQTICAAAEKNDPVIGPPVTVAVCTRDRPDELEACIKHLMRLDYPSFDILICDNSADPAPTRKIAETLGVGYTRQPIAGLSRARNTALAAAQHRWVAFTDDDCRPESNWLSELVRELQDTSCHCVCGLVLPAQLENAAEIAFEIYGGLGRGYYPIVYDPSFIRRGRWAPAPTWKIGAGANMLLDAQLVNQLGGYDIDMGPGGVGGCGEDTLIFYQLLRGGYNIHYTPRAIVHHYHRSSDEALRKQIYSYATGHAAYHVRVLWSYWDHRSLLQLIYHLPRWFARNFKRGIAGRTKYPFTLVPLEVKGTLAGVLKYSAAKLHRFVTTLPKKLRRRRATLQLNVPPPVDSPKKYDLPPVKKSFRAA